MQVDWALELDKKYAYAPPVLNLAKDSRKQAKKELRH